MNDIVKDRYKNGVLFTRHPR